MSVKFANNAHSTLASSVSTSATSITVASGHGARFPSLSSGEFFYATLIDTSNNLEIVKVTARSTDVLTATRAQESTSARAFASGDRIELRVTAQGITDATNIDNIVPSQSGNSGKFLTTDGTNVSFGTVTAPTATAVSDQTNASTGYFDLPSGTTAQRPSGASGMIRYNTNTYGYEAWHTSSSNDQFLSLGPFVAVRFNGNNASVHEYYGNFGSVARSASGRYTLNFANAEDNDNYLWHIVTDTNNSRTGNHVGPISGQSGYYFNYGTSSFTFTTAEYSGLARSDADIVWVALWRMPNT